MDPSHMIPVYLVDSIDLSKTTKTYHLSTKTPSGELAAFVANRVFGHILNDDAGHPYDYRFRDEHNVVLDPDITLEMAKVRPESTLHITYMPSAAGPTA